MRVREIANRLASIYMTSRCCGREPLGPTARSQVRSSCHAPHGTEGPADGEGNAMNDRWLIMIAVLLMIAVARWAAVVWLAWL
jgi:hypothetical protein